MSKMTATSKIIEAVNKDGSHYGWLFHCLGCGWSHRFDSRWTFNGDRDKPTFSPSLLVERGVVERCHSFVTDGKIQYLNDSTHPLKGQTVEIPAWKSIYPDLYGGTVE